MVQYQPHEWHLRFVEQAKWTSELRSYLINLAELDQNSLIIDVGCGTGALFNEIIGIHDHFFGLDINFSSIKYARENHPNTDLIHGDGRNLPLMDDCFDLAFCHFLLLWVPESGRVIKEMTRITKPGGKVIAFAEPDYGGRIDYPEELAHLGEKQIKSLIKQGADPYIGRQLASIFVEAGLTSIRTGVIGGEWYGTPDLKSWESEWEVLESDLNLLSMDFSIREFNRLKLIDKWSYIQGKRTLYVPTFYALGESN